MLRVLVFFIGIKFSYLIFFSFGAGSFSWWLINSPGCRPLYNTTFAADFVVDENDVSPFRPSEVEGCYVRYEKIEVTHASIQLVLSVLGEIL